MRWFCTVLFLALLSNAGAQPLKTALVYSVQPPANKVTRPPVLILLHGYGSNESDLYSFGTRLNSNFLTITFRGMYGTQGGGYAWFPLQFKNDGSLSYDYGLVTVARKKILAAISALCREYKADSNQVYILGFSQGAIMCFELAMHSPSGIKGILALSGRMLPETEKLAPGGSLNHLGCFIGHGINDEVLKVKESENACLVLKKFKVNDLVFKKYEMAHTISGTELEDIRQWIRPHLQTPK